MNAGELKVSCVFSSATILPAKDDKEEIDGEVEGEQVAYLSCSVILSRQEQNSLSIGAYRELLQRAFQRALQADAGHTGHTGHTGHVAHEMCIPKADLMNDWSQSFAREVTAPTPEKDHAVTDVEMMRSSFVVTLLPFPEDFLALLVSKLTAPDFCFVVSESSASASVHAAMRTRTQWLVEEDATMRMAALDLLPQSGRRLCLCLANEIKRPPPSIEVDIIGTVQHSDVNSKMYTCYSIVVRQDTMQWTVEKRYSEFCQLFRDLQAQDSSDKLAAVPPLPGKNVIKSTYNRQAVETRRQPLLAVWLQALVAMTAQLPNFLVLEFLGMLAAKPASRRHVIALSKLCEEARCGDLVLFRSRNSASKLQRGLTGSEWDHVGLIVYPPVPEGSTGQPSSNMHLLEATGDGVTILPISSRLRAYHFYRCCRTVALRRLSCADGAALDLAQLNQFLLLARKKRYAFNLGDLLGGLREGAKKEDDSKTFFCSSLVAAALRAAAVIPSHCNDRSFWPGSFAADSHIDDVVCAGFSYAPPILIETKELELLQLRHGPPRAGPGPSAAEMSLPSHALAAPALPFVPSIY